MVPKATYQLQAHHAQSKGCLAGGQSEAQPPWGPGFCSASRWETQEKAPGLGTQHPSAAVSPEGCLLTNLPAGLTQKWRTPYCGLDAGPEAEWVATPGGPMEAETKAQKAAVRLGTSFATHLCLFVAEQFLPRWALAKGKQLEQLSHMQKLMGQGGELETELETEEGWPWRISLSS